MCDLILHNANVITMDPARPRAGLVAVSGDRILAVTEENSLPRLRERGTRIIDCGGRTLVPGFVDAHCHVHAYAESLVSLNLSRREQVLSIADLQRKIRDFCNDRPPGTWIRGKSYDEFRIAENRHPNRWDLDSAAPFHPVKLTHRSGHAHVLNSLALEYAGITAETGDPPGGWIDRDLETGNPTGILYGMSGYLAEKIPALDEAELRQGVTLVNGKLLSCGITSVQDASFVNDLRRWSQFEAWKAQGIFQPRLTVMTGPEFIARARQELLESRAGESEFRLGGVKIIADQVTGSLHPSRGELKKKVAAAHEAGLQAAIHAVDPPVIEAACDAVEYALKRHPREDPRHRLEHCSVCPPPLLRRLVSLGITVVTQPSFIYFSGDRYLKMVSPNDLENLYPIGSMVQRGLPVGFSSDFPIAEPNPLIGIQAAVTREAESGDPIQPEQGIGVSDALRLYALGAAAANFEEGIKGSVVPGKLADLVLLSEDPLTALTEHIKDIQVEMTILGGKIVWERAFQSGGAGSAESRGEIP
jgi:predicted amidohydrolase YtcJ